MAEHLQNKIDLNPIRDLVSLTATKNDTALENETINQCAIDIGKALMRYFSPISRTARRSQLTDDAVLADIQALRKSLTAAAKIAQSLQHKGRWEPTRFNGEKIAYLTKEQDELSARVGVFFNNEIFEKYAFGFAQELIEIEHALDLFGKELAKSPSSAAGKDIRGHAARSTHPEYHRLVGSLAVAFEIITTKSASAWRSSYYVEGKDDPKNVEAEFVIFFQECWKLISKTQPPPGQESIKNALISSNYSNGNMPV